MCFGMAIGQVGIKDPRHKSDVSLIRHVKDVQGRLMNTVIIPL